MDKNGGLHSDIADGWVRFCIEQSCLSALLVLFTIQL